MYHYASEDKCSASKCTKNRLVAIGRALSRLAEGSYSAPQT